MRYNQNIWRARIVINQPPVAEADFIPIEVEDDEGLFRVLATATDPDRDSLDITAVIEAGGESIPVENGQLVEIAIGDDCEIEWDDGVLEIEALEVVLKVTAIDTGDLSDTATATPEFAEEED